jgi:hypothetical protein
LDTGYTCRALGVGPILGQAIMLVINHAAGQGVSNRGAVQVVFVLHIYDVVGFREDCGVKQKHTHTVTKILRFSRPQPGCH